MYHPAVGRRRTHGDSMTDAQLDNETDVTELTIAPDGRVFAFGTSRPVQESLLSPGKEQEPRWRPAARDHAPHDPGAGGRESHVHQRAQLLRPAPGMAGQFSHAGRTHRIELPAQH